MNSSRFLTALGTLIALLIAPSLLTGCEFGNKKKSELTGYDTISGYYLTQPQSISFQAQVGSSAVRSKNGLVAEIPLFLKTVMANPTMLVLDDPINGIGSLRAHSSTGTGFMTYMDAKTGEYGASSTDSATVNGCAFTRTVTTIGSFTQLAVQQMAGDHWARGKVALDYETVYATVGDEQDCAPVREQFRLCFVNGGADCATESDSIFNAAFVSDMVTPFVNTGILTPAEIATAKKLEYRATYQ